MGAAGVIDALIAVRPVATGAEEEDVIRSMCNVTVDKLNAEQFSALGGPATLLRLAALVDRTDVYRAICLGSVLNCMSNGIPLDIPKADVRALMKSAGASFRVQLVAIITGCFLLPEEPLLHEMVRATA